MLARLERRAFAGDIMAMMTLVHLARKATRAVHGRLFNDQPSVPPPLLNADQKPDKITGLVARREAMYCWLGGNKWHEFPTLAVRGDGEFESKQKQMIAGLTDGPPFKGRSQKANLIRMLFQDIVWPEFLEIQSGQKQPANELEKEIFDLPFLTFASISKWSELAVKWIEIQNVGELRLYDENSKLYRLADAKSELEKEKRKKIARLKVKEKKLRATGYHGGLGEIEQVGLDRARDKIRKMTVTRSMVRTAMKSRITAWLKTNLAE